MLAKLGRASSSSRALPPAPPPSIASASTEEDISAGKALLKLLRLPHNRICADCRAPLVTSDQIYASLGVSKTLPHAVFICVDCCTAHRSLGSSVCRTKSIHHDIWSSGELELVRSLGNKATNMTFERNIPPNWVGDYATRAVHDPSLALPPPPGSSSGAMGGGVLAFGSVRTNPPQHPASSHGMHGKGGKAAADDSDSESDGKTSGDEEDYNNEDGPLPPSGGVPSAAGGLIVGNIVLPGANCKTRIPCRTSSAKEREIFARDRKSVV